MGKRIGPDPPELLLNWGIFSTLEEYIIIIIVTFSQILVQRESPRTHTLVEHHQTTQTITFFYKRQTIQKSLPNSFFTTAAIDGLWVPPLPLFHHGFSFNCLTGPRTLKDVSIH